MSLNTPIAKIPIYASEYMAYNEGKISAFAASVFYNYERGWSVDYQGALWSRYLASKGGIAPLNTEANREDFRVFLSRYRLFGLNADVLNIVADPNLMDPYYTKVLMNSFGNLSELERKDLWKGFLASQGLQGSPPDTEALRKAFSSYIDNLYARQTHMVGETTITKQEAQSRVLLDKVMESINGMVTACTNFIDKYSSLVMVFGTLQQEYTAMMTSTPSVSADNKSGKVVCPTVSTGGALKSLSTVQPDEITLGYYGYTFKTVLDWGITKAMASPGETFTFGKADGTMGGAFGFTYNKVSSTFEVSLTTTSGTTTTNFPTNTTDPATGKVIPHTNEELISTSWDKMKQLITGAAHAVSPTLTPEAYLNGKAAVPGRWVTQQAATPTDANTKTLQEETQYRLEQNVLLQQYADGARSRRELIQDITKQLQSVLGQGKETLNAQTDLWTSILESIKNIMGAIFKKN